MERNWVYDEVIKRGLAYARTRGLDLGTEIAVVRIGDIVREPSVIPDATMIGAIREAVSRGLRWPPQMPLPVLACDGVSCMTLDGNHRLKAAKLAGLEEVPAVVSSLETWEALLPVIEQEDAIPYDDFIAILAEAGSKDIRENLRLEAEAREEFG